MLYWLRFPFIRFAIFISSGITLYDSLPGHYPVLSAFFVILLLAYLAIIIIFRKDRFRKYNSVPGMVSMILLGLAGYLISSFHDDKNNRDHLLNYNKPVDFYSGKVIEVTKDDSLQFKFIIGCLYAGSGPAGENHSGKILVTMFKEYPRQEQPAKPGDLVLIRGTPRRIQPPGNPGQFDYSEYMARKNIYYQHIAGDDDVFLLNKSHSINTLYLFRRINDRFSKMLASAIPDPETQALVSALALGVKDNLDESTIQDFTKAGINHILAVSGLHVGILYLVLVILLRPLYTRPKTGLSASIIIIFILIAYAFITGLTPSVLRSVVMFTFIELGRRLGRKAATLNTLAASAFFLLCFNPNFIFSVGFQLSYLAVAGIVIFQPWIYRLLSFEGLITDYVWQLISVTIAAQLTTFPLTVYYFHSFPVYFIIANIIAIPASFILLIIGFGIISLHFIPFLGNVLGMIATAISWILSYAIHGLTTLPLNQINGIYLNKFMVICLFIFIVMVMQLLTDRKPGFIYGSAIVLFIFSISVIGHKLNFRHQDKIIFYRMNTGPLIELVNGGAGIIIKDRSIPIPESRISDIVGNNCLAEGHPFKITPVDDLDGNIAYTSLPGFDIIIWEGKVLYIIYDARKLLLQSSKPPVQADYILIAHNSAYRTGEILNLFGSDNWLIDASNSPRSIEIAKKMFASKNIIPVSIPEQGAVSFRISNRR